MSQGYVAEFPLFEGTGTRVRPTRMSAYLTEMTLALSEGERCPALREALSSRRALRSLRERANIAARGSQAGVLRQTKVFSSERS